MESEATQVLFNLLGWMAFGICVLLGIAKASPVGMFRALWLAASVWFCYKLADHFAVPLAGPVGGLLGLSGIGAEIAGYWSAFLAAAILSALWHTFVAQYRVVVVPIVEQIGTPLLGAAAGVFFGLGVFQSLLISENVREKFPSVATLARNWIGASGQTWFPAERTPPAVDGDVQNPEQPAATQGRQGQPAQQPAPETPQQRRSKAADMLGIDQPSP